MAKQLVALVTLVLIATGFAARCAEALPLEPIETIVRLPPLTLVTRSPPTTTRRFTLGPIFTLPPVSSASTTTTTTTEPPTTTTTTEPPTTTTTEPPTTTTTEPPTTTTTTATWTTPTTSTTEPPTTTTATWTTPTTSTTEPPTTTTTATWTTPTTTTTTTTTTAAPTTTSATPPPTTTTVTTTSAVTSTTTATTTTTATVAPTTNAPPDNAVSAAPTDLTEPPLPSNVASLPLDLRAAFQLSGTRWSTLINDATQTVALNAALTTDLAVLLGVPTGDVILLAVRNGASGTLIVAFGVSESTGRSASSLMASFAGAGASTQWLLNTLDQYHRVTAESVAVVNTGVAFANTPAPTFNAAGSMLRDAARLTLLLTSIVVASCHLV